MENFINNPLFQALFNSPVPRIILKANAPVFTIITSNDAHKIVTNLVGKDINEKSVWEIFDPNEAGGDGGILLKEALTKAQTSNQTVLMPPFRYDMSATDGDGMVEKWWQLEIMPIGGDKNAPKYLLTTTNDISYQISKDKEKENTQRQLEDLVEQRTRKLALSEVKFRNLVEHSPTAMAMLLGKDLILDAANSQMLKFWHHPDKIITLDLLMGNPLKDALPWVAEQYKNAITSVFETSNSVSFSEFQYFPGPHAPSHESYATINFNPVFDPDGQVSAIIISAHDITEQVNARKELEQAYEQVKLSKQAAQLGMFDIDLNTGVMEWDRRCRELFGINHNATVTYEGDFLVGLHPDDREHIHHVIEKLFDKELSDGIYDVEYRTVGAEDGKIRWVRAKGKVYFDTNNIAVRFIGSVLDITDQKHEEQLRNDFITMVSHELKTPLTSVQGYVQLLHRKALRNDDITALPVLSQAEKQVVKMGKMINGFLNLSRLESRKLPLDISAVDMKVLMEEVVEEIKLSSPEAKINLNCSSSIFAEADDDKIAHVLFNLLSNAIKYSGKDKPIDIKCYLDDEQVIVSVTDEGIGISKEAMGRLFERFYRIENPETKFISGFGIGLYLSREIVQLHKGKMWVESKPNKGSTFFFSLPLAVPVL